MQRFYFLSARKLFLLLGIIFFSTQISWSQATYVPYSYQFDQKFDAEIYSINSSQHTSLKPFIIDSTLNGRYNTLMQVGVDSSRKGWILRKIFNEHLFDERTSEYTFYADFLPDLQIGHDFKNKANTNLNTRGYQVGGTIGSKFFFYSSGYEDQARFPNYVHEYVKQTTNVPGEAYDRDNLNSPTADWSYVTAIVSYTPIKQLNITLGEDKTFIGDGYRSLLLSDYASNYPLLRFTANLGPVQYMFMIADLEDRRLAGYDDFGNNRRKIAGFHYVDWNVTNRFSVGVFDAVIAAGANEDGSVTHGFDVNYINPLVFSSSLGPSAPYKDNTLNGFTAKYKVLDKTAIYAQLLLDNVGGSTEPKNTGGYQAGIRGADLFGVTNFNYLFEYNTVKPYTYSSPQVISNYTEYSEPLGEVLGANFKEGTGILDYSIGRFDFQGELNYASYGVDSSKTEDIGTDLKKAYDPAAINGVATGQGIKTHLYYAEGTIAFIINPKTNLRFELGALYRDETNKLGTTKTALITFGLRSTFRDLYHDF